MATVYRRTDQDSPKPYVASWRDSTGRQRKRSFADEDEARAYLKELRLGRRDPDVERETIGDYFERVYLPDKIDLKPTSHASLVSLWTNRVAPVWAGVRLCDVTHPQVARWVTGMKAEAARGELSTSRLRQSYHTLSAIFEMAVRDGAMVNNPAKGVRLPKLGRTTRTAITEAELIALGEAAGKIDVQHRVHVWVLGYAGLRWGESVALTVGDFDRRRGQLTVAKSVSDADGRLVLGSTKTAQRRIVPLAPWLAEELAALVAGRERTALIFPGATGRWQRNQGARKRWWNRARDAAGLPEEVTPHVMRHTCASILAASGADIVSVGALLGHASVQTTMAVYSHADSDALRAITARLGQLGPGSDGRLRAVQ